METKFNRNTKKLHLLKRKMIAKMEVFYDTVARNKDIAIFRTKKNGRVVCHKAFGTMATAGLVVSLLTPAGLVYGEEVEETNTNDGTPDKELIIASESEQEEAVEPATEEQVLEEKEAEPVAEEPVEQEESEIKQDEVKVEEQVPEENKAETTEMEEQVLEEKEAELVEQEKDEIKQDEVKADETEEVKADETEKVKEQVSKEKVTKVQTAEAKAENVKEKNAKAKAEKDDFMEVTSVRPGVNISTNEDKVEYAIDKDTTYMVITTKDGRQVIYNVQDLGNPNIDKFVNSYNKISDDKIVAGFLMTDRVDENGNAYIKVSTGKYRYPVLGADGLPMLENGEVVYFESDHMIAGREDGEELFDDIVVGQYVVDPVTGEKRFIADKGTKVTFGTNAPREEKNPDEHLQTSKPIEKETPDPTPDPKNPTPDPKDPTPAQETPTENPTPAQETPTEKPAPGKWTTRIAKTGYERHALAQTGDSIKSMVVGGMACVALASGLVLLAATYRKVQEESAKKLILR